MECSFITITPFKGNKITSRVAISILDAQVQYKNGEFTP